MKQFRRKQMRVKLDFTCVNADYFDSNFLDYYDLLTIELSQSKVHGFYCKSFYKLKSILAIKCLGLDKDFYYTLPQFMCKSEIY
nr:unnamed protein product [uncultured bacterium]